MIGFLTVLVCLGAGVASANTIRYVFQGVTDLGGGQYRWDYGVQLEFAKLVPQAQEQGDQYATLYDIGSYVRGSATFTPDPVLPAGSWTLTEQLTGRNPLQPLPPANFSDRAYMYNVTWEYTGNTLITANPFQNLGTLSVTTRNGWGRLDWAASQDHDLYGNLQGGWYQTRVSAPEPSVLLVLGSSFLGLAGLGRSRRKK